MYRKINSCIGILDTSYIRILSREYFINNTHVEILTYLANSRVFYVHVSSKYLRSIE